MNLDIQKITIQKIKNALVSTLLIGGMTALFGVFGWYLFGKVALILAPAAVLTLLLSSRGGTPAQLMKAQNAVALSHRNAPGLIGRIYELSAKAGLPAQPDVYYIPNRIPNALSIGGGDRPAIAFTSGLVERLDEREMTGVIAHEISHIRNHDVFLLTLAERIKRITSGMTFAGQLLLFLNLPLVLFTGFSLPWLLLLVLAAAPLLSFVLQLALLRTREYAADLSAAELTGDPEGLALALKKIELRPEGLFGFIFPVRQQRESSFLRTHPSTEERVRRLLALKRRRENAVLSSRKYF